MSLFSKNISSGLFSSKQSPKQPVANTSGFDPYSNTPYLTGVGQRFKTILDLGKSLTQTTLRSMASVPGMISQALPGGQDELKVPGILQPLFGKEPVPSLSRRIAEGEIKATDVGIPSAPQGYKSPALWVSAPLIIGMTALDFTPLGGEKTALDKLAKEGTEDGIIKLLNKMEIFPEKTLVTNLKNTKTTQEVTDILNQKAMEGLSNKIRNLKNLVANDPFDEVAAQQLKKAEAELADATRKLRKSPDVPPAPKPAPKPAVETSPVKAPKQPELLRLVDDVGEKKVLDSLAEDIIRIEKSQATREIINLERLAISDAGKAVIQGEAELLKPRIEALVGDTLTNKEVIKLAQETGEVLMETIGREQTAALEAALLNARRSMATVAESGTMTKEFADNMLVVKTQGANAGRIVQSFNISAKPGAKFSPMETMTKALMDLGKTSDEILDASKGINFNDTNQASEFYRKFVKPRAGEWINTLRYNSMLTGITTHLKNISANLLNSTIRPVIEKMIASGVDMLSSKITGEARSKYAGEAGKYIQGYLKSYKDAVIKFGEVWRGISPMTNLDVMRIPLAPTGKLRVLENILNVGARALDASDQFFQTMSKAGEIGSLTYRQSKGTSVFNMEQIAEESAKYGLFRSDLHPSGQGSLLNGLDEMTRFVEMARNSKYRVMSIPANLAIPFLRTGSNIGKQFIEFAPGLGYLTMIGAEDKVLQFTRATMGTGLAVVVGTAIASNRLTWGEPKTTAEKNKYRANGMQPYSIKLGNKWVQYQYLPPFISAPLAFMAGTHDLLEHGKIDQSTSDMIMGAFARGAGFFSDQSYFKSIGDLMSAIGGDEFAADRLIGNIPQQFIPFRALGGWLARLADDTQRTIDNKEGFINRQVELLMMNVPGLSDNLKPRLGPNGRPIKNTNNIINSFSPVKIQTQTDRQERAQAQSDRAAKIRRNSTGGSSSGGSGLFNGL